MKPNLLVALFVSCMNKLFRHPSGSVMRGGGEVRGREAGNNNK